MSDVQRAPDEPLGFIPEPLTPWQRMRVYRNVAKRMRETGNHYEADALERFAQKSAQETVIEGEAE